MCKANAGVRRAGDDRPLLRKKMKPKFLRFTQKPWAAAAPYIAGAAAYVGGTALGYQGNRRNMKTSQSFQERMRETQYTTQVADMKRAGLNPILAAQQGGGAGTPGGGSASGGPDMGGIVSSALAAKKISAELDLINSQTDQNKAGKLSAQTQAILNMANSEKAVASAKQITAATEGQGIRNLILRLEEMKFKTVGGGWLGTLLDNAIKVLRSTIRGATNYAGDAADTYRRKARIAKPPVRPERGKGSDERRQRRHKKQMQRNKERKEVNKNRGK